MEVSKNVKFINIDDGTVIFSDKATYLRNDEIIFTEGNSKALNKNNSITATNFKFDKNKNILNASGNVKFIDASDDTIIYSDKATYLRNDEIIFTEGNSKALNKNNSISATNFKFDKNKNILNAEIDVIFNDHKKQTIITSDKATYLRNDEIIFTEGNSKALNKNNSITATNFKFDKIKIFKRRN